MKIRIRAHTVRYRLTQSEVATLSDKGYIEEITPFKNAKLVYAVQLMEGLDGLEIEYTADRIVLLVPDQLGRQWHTTDLVSIKGEMHLENGDQLSLLLEKDFTCLDNREEDETDQYPNPTAGK